VGQSANFEMRVNMYDSDKLIAGKGSRLIGQCIFLNEQKIYRVEGAVSNNDITLNCIDTDGKILYSFLFPKADGQKKRQNGQWTNGKEKLDAYLDSPSNFDIPNSQLLGFCVGINVRRNAIENDSIARPILSSVPKIPYLQIDEGYRLDKRAYLRADYYGNDYLEFADTTLAADSSKQIARLAWQLLSTAKASPYILEIKTLETKNAPLKVELALLHFQGGQWVKMDSSAFPKQYWQEGKLSLPKHIEHFYNGNDQLIFYVAADKKPIIWKWKEERFVE
jgi:hypothetical protein